MPGFEPLPFVLPEERPATAEPFAPPVGAAAPDEVGNRTSGEPVLARNPGRADAGEAAETASKAEATDTGIASRAEATDTGIASRADATGAETASAETASRAEATGAEIASDDESLEQVWPDPMVAAIPAAGVDPTPVFGVAVDVGEIGRPSLTSSFAEDAAQGTVAPLPGHARYYPIVANSQVGFFLDRFTGDRRESISTWLGRSGRFMSMIRETLKKHGLPEDLAFTAMIESGFNPVATSRAGARGLWQFMAATAKRYGLRVDQWVDERLDPEKSTVAAAAYLRDLYNLFGSWFLAQAAYNAGEAAIARAIRATGSSDFWTLARTGFLHRETKDFVPQIVAAIQIGREPNRFGFEHPPSSSPSVDRVAVPPQTDLRWLSASTGISADTLQSLNPALVKGVTPPGGSFELKVPEGASSQVMAAVKRGKRVVVTFPGSGTTRASGNGQEVHVVRPRDTVQSIARRYGISVGDVMRWNDLGRKDPIRPGDRLRITTILGGR